MHTQDFSGFESQTLKSITNMFFFKFILSIFSAVLYVSWDRALGFIYCPGLLLGAPRFLEELICQLYAKLSTLISPQFNINMTTTDGRNFLCPGSRLGQESWILEFREFFSRCTRGDSDFLCTYA